MVGCGGAPVRLVRGCGPGGGLTGLAAAGSRLETLLEGVGALCGGGAVLQAQFPVLAAAVLFGVAGRAQGLSQGT